MLLNCLERNRRTFEDTGVSVLVLKGRFLAVLQFWELGVLATDACILMDFLDILAV